MATVNVTSDFSVPVGLAILPLMDEVQIVNPGLNTIDAALMNQWLAQNELSAHVVSGVIIIGDVAHNNAGFSILNPASFSLNISTMTIGETIGTLTATNNPTSFSIFSGDPSNHFLLSNSGSLTLTAAGVSALGGVGANGLPVTPSTTLIVQVANSTGPTNGSVTISYFATLIALLARSALMLAKARFNPQLVIYLTDSNGVILTDAGGNYLTGN